MITETLDQRIAALPASDLFKLPVKMVPGCAQNLYHIEDADGRMISDGGYGGEIAIAEIINGYGEALPLIAALRAERDEARRERDALAKFKAWVHDYLDSKGIPHHPPGTHGEHGCRIGDRMDHLFARIDETKKQLAAAVERERGMREAMELIAQQDCKTYETWQAGVEWMQEHARKALAAPPVDNQPAACGERME